MEQQHALVLSALNASLNSATSKTEREAVDAFLKQLKESHECMHMMIHILVNDIPEHNEYVRMLALSILSDWMKDWWNRINEGDQSIIKTNILGLLAGVLGRSPIKPLRMKLAVMVANIAVRQFPQLWPNFLEEMVSLWHSSSTELQETAIMAIEFLAVDSIDSDFNSALPSNRRQDILTGLKGKLTNLLASTFTYFMQCVSQYQSGPRGSPESARSMVLMNAVLRMVLPFVSFAKPEVHTYILILDT
jgi:hypothetical protein